MDPIVEQRKLHDKAFKIVEEGIDMDGRNQIEQAQERYNEGIKLMTKAMTLHFGIGQM